MAGDRHSVSGNYVRELLGERCQRIDDRVVTEIAEDAPLVALE